MSATTDYYRELLEVVYCTLPPREGRALKRKFPLLDAAVKGTLAHDVQPMKIAQHISAPNAYSRSLVEPTPFGRIRQ